MDMKTTFLNGEVKEVIYLKPLSFEIKRQEKKVYKLNNAFHAFMHTLCKA